MIFALLGVSTPVFWLGLLLMLFVGVHLRWLPPSGYGRGQWYYLILPAVTLGTAITGLIARTTRSAMLNVIRQDYITTARAKGVSNTRVTYKHALRNALIPVVTVVGVQAGNVLSGAVVTETVFNWPGIGRLLVDSINQRDLPMAQGCVLFIATVFVLINLTVDFIYGFIDPRIRYN
jgi:peptide/nickel transport system permease protein